MRIGPVLLACCFVLASTAAPAQRRVVKSGQFPKRVQRRIDSLPPILRLVVQAANSLSFSGERVVEQNVRNRTLRHIEYVLRQGPRIRVEFPSDSPFRGQVIIDNGQERRHYLPGRNEIQIQPGHRDDALNRLVNNRNQLQHPRVGFADGGVIAGRSTTLANIMDGTGHVVQQLWVDGQTGAVLKRVGYDNANRVIAFFEFSQINYNPSIGPNAFVISRPNARLITPEDDLRGKAKRQNLPGLMVPKSLGFELLSSNVSKRANVQVLAEQFKGPRGRLSIFVLRAHIDPAQLEKRSGPNTHAYSFETSGVTYVLIGPYTAAQLQSIANSATRI